MKLDLGRGFWWNVGMFAMEFSEWVRLVLGLGMLGLAWAGSKMPLELYWVGYPDVRGKRLAKTLMVSMEVVFGVVLLGFPLGAAALLLVVVYASRRVRRWEVFGKVEGLKRFRDY